MVPFLLTHFHKNLLFRSGHRTWDRFYGKTWYFRPFKSRTHGRGGVYCSIIKEFNFNEGVNLKYPNIDALGESCKTIVTRISSLDKELDQEEIDLIKIYSWKGIYASNTTWLRIIQLGRNKVPSVMKIPILAPNDFFKSKFQNSLF